MKETEDKIKNSLSEFKRYIRGEMTKGEENSFQMKLQEGPYAQAIIEGCFSGFYGRVEAKGVDSLKNPLKESYNRSGKKIFVYSGITVAALLMISYGGYIILENNIPVWMQSNKIFTSGSSDARGASKITGQDQAGSIYVTDSIEAEYKKDLSIVSSDTSGSALIEKSAYAGDTGEMSITELKDSGLVNTVGRLSANDTGAGLKSEIKPDTVILSEVHDPTFKAGNESSVHQVPQPVDGTVSFRNYIDANIKNPDTHSRTSGDEAVAVAVVSFLVRVTGIIDSLRVISSPGEEYALEAIRLIKEGPAWKPAEADGKAIEEEVRLRIVWR